jgi:predicted amidohydrolase YtcJ
LFPLERAGAQPEEEGRATVFAARRIITMDPAQPFADAVAVREGRILAVGKLPEVLHWLEGMPREIDSRFEHKVILPGFVESHMHPFLLGLYGIFEYVGSEDRRLPDGTVEPGLATKADVLGKLESLVRSYDAETPLMARGYDPAKLGGERPTLAELDAVSSAVPIFVWDFTLHSAYVNTPMLRLANVDPSTSPEGFLEELAQVGPALTAGLLKLPERLGKLMPLVALEMVRGGVTSAAEMGTSSPMILEAYRQALADPRFPGRLTLYEGIPGYQQRGLAPEDALASLRKTIEELEALPNLEDRLTIRGVKAWVDGSPQNYSAQMAWPGYWSGRQPGLSVNLTQSEMQKWLAPFHEAGFQIKLHIAGGAATEQALRALETVLAEAPRPDHRHTLEHAMVVSEAQFRRAKALGLGMSIQPLHVYYTGDRYHEEIAGPNKAAALSNAAAASRNGVPWALHTDAPLFPLRPLVAVWSAANRQTTSGRVLGPGNRISVMDGLAGITINAAYLLGEDDVKGSIEVGKLADFAVLEEDPLQVPPEQIRDIEVWGTIVGGQVFPAR